MSTRKRHLPLSDTTLLSYRLSPSNTGLTIVSITLPCLPHYTGGHCPHSLSPPPPSNPQPITPTTMRAFVAAILLPLAVLASPLATGRSEIAPLEASGENIDDAYVVVFKKGTDLNTIALHLSGVDDSHSAHVSLISSLPSRSTQRYLLGRGPQDAEYRASTPPGVIAYGHHPTDTRLATIHLYRRRREGEDRWCPPCLHPNC